jgi:hypothetical protein
MTARDPMVVGSCVSASTVKRSNLIAVGIAHGSKQNMIVPFLFDPFRVGVSIDSNPVALPPAIKFVRCADEASAPRLSLFQHSSKTSRCRCFRLLFDNRQSDVTSHDKIRKGEESNST